MYKWMTTAHAPRSEALGHICGRACRMSAEAAVVEARHFCERTQMGELNGRGKKSEVLWSLENSKNLLGNDASPASAVDA